MPLKLAKLGVLFTQNPFHLAVMIFSYFITLLFFIRKPEDRHFHGGNNIKSVNLYFFFARYLFYCLAALAVPFVSPVEIRGLYCNYMQH